MTGKRRLVLTAVLLGVTVWASGAASADDMVDPIPAKALAMIESANARLEASGSSIRISEAWFFTVGRGTDPYRRLRTGPRWPKSDVGYILDESDYTTDLPPGEVEEALVRAYGSWNEVNNTTISAARWADPGTNMDVLDGTFVGGECVDIFDISSPNLDLVQGLIYPEADVVVGGWLNADYFVKCLGNASIIGVTWTFSDVDSNGDQYSDRLYVEQFYNEGFEWVTSGAQFLDYDAGFDVETIAVHENGHTHGLGHFGGPNANQPFKLQPNGRVFDPEAVMNPIYLGGEKRDLLPTDVAGLRTLYGRKGN